MDYMEKLNSYTIPEDNFNNEYLFNKTPAYLNYDKWVKGENKILYITGLSGTGKGYYAKKIAEKEGNCIIFELDKFENYPWYINSKDKEKPPVAKGDKVIYKYLKDNYDLSTDIFRDDIERYNTLLSKFCMYLINYTKENPDHRYIMEGIQIFSDKAFNYISKEDSVVVIRTSSVKSMNKNMSRPHPEIRNRLHGYTDAQKMLKDFQNRLGIGDVKIASESSISTFSNVEALSLWMKKNISYSNFTQLKSTEEVFKTRCGSCHDQVVFEMYVLSKMGLRPQAMILCECDASQTRAGVTHSFVYYNKNGKCYWFENAWEPQAGIHEMKSLDEIVFAIKKLHDNGSWGNKPVYPNIIMKSFTNYIPGDTLQDLMDKNFSS